MGAATWTTLRCRAELVHGDPVRARRDLLACLEWIDRAGDERVRWNMRLLLVAEAAARGDRAPLDAFVHEHPPRSEAYRLQVEVVEALAGGLLAAEADDLAGLATSLEQAHELASLGHLQEVHTLATWVVRKLEESRHWWRIDRDGGWHQAPGHARQTVKGRANQRVLAYLVSLNAADRHASASAAALVNAGWPGERIVAKAARNRVRVALSTLRRAGLGELIERAEGGWRLSASRTIRAVTGRSAG